MRPRTVAALVCITAALGASCDDDPITPQPTPLWREASLPAIAAGGLVQVDARAGRVVAVGATGSDSMPQWLALERQGSGSWSFIPQPVGADLEVLPLDVALDPAGRAVFMGAAYVPGSVAQLVPVLFDERTHGWVFVGTDRLNAVAFGRGDTVRAVATGSRTLAIVSVAPSRWRIEDLGFTTPQEVGLVDLQVTNGVFYACGFNDGATEHAILFRNAASGWQSISVGNLSTVELRAVSADSNGAVWLGGVNHAADPPAAFLARRSTSGDWFDVVLPPMTGTVRDILVASNGDVYLAAGNEHGRILRWDGMMWMTEITRREARILALAESNGLLIAVGVATRGTSLPPQPLVLERTF